MLEYAKKNLAYVNVFIREPFAHKILISEKISRVSFISDVGGLLGLFMGFSFVSIAEIIYHALTVSIFLMNYMKLKFVLYILNFFTIIGIFHAFY